MHIQVEETLALSECCGALPFGEMDSQSNSGRCAKCHENAVFVKACPQCESTNLNEDNNLCWECNENAYS